MADNYQPKFQHQDWKDNVDLVSAEDPVKGLNKRFNDLKAEFQEIARIIGQINSIWVGGASGSISYSRGNVGIGIGTTSPTAKLHIYSADNDAFKITNTTVSKTCRIGVDSLGAWIEPVETNNSIRLNANPSLVGLYIEGTDGKVGIGTTNPRERLSISGGHAEVDINFGIGFNPSGDKFVYEGMDMGDYSLGWFKDSEAPTSAMAWLSGYGGIKLFTNKQLRYTLDFEGNFNKISSRELKEGIADLSAKEAVEMLEELNPVKYNLKADKEKNLHIGFIAEDVPDLVASRDRKAVCSDNIIVILTKVVKEQQETIAELVMKVKTLEEKNNVLGLFE